MQTLIGFNCRVTKAEHEWICVLAKHYGWEFVATREFTGAVAVWLGSRGAYFTEPAPESNVATQTLSLGLSEFVEKLVAGPGALQSSSVEIALWPGSLTATVHPSGMVDFKHTRSQITYSIGTANLTEFFQAWLLTEAGAPFRK